MGYFYEFRGNLKIKAPVTGASKYLVVKFKKEQILYLLDTFLHSPLSLETAPCPLVVQQLKTIMPFPTLVPLGLWVLFP